MCWEMWADRRSVLLLKGELYEVYRLELPIQIKGQKVDQNQQIYF